MPLQVTVVTTQWAGDQSAILEGPQTIRLGGFLDDDVAIQEICVAPGQYTMALYDSYGDGWSGGSNISIQEMLADDSTTVRSTAVVASLLEGTSMTTTFFLGPTPLPPPLLPPSSPPPVPQLVEEP